jgi:hypothetical protein
MAGRVVSNPDGIGIVRAVGAAGAGEHLVALEYAPGEPSRDAPDIRGYPVFDQDGQRVASVKTLLINPASGRARAAILTNRKNQRFSVPLELLDPDTSIPQVRGRFPAGRLEHAAPPEVPGVCGVPAAADGGFAG